MAITRRVFGLAAAAAVLLLLLASPAGAQPATRDDSKRKAARDLHTLGHKLFEHGAYAEAISAFEQAYALTQKQETLYNLGRAYAAAGNSTAALAKLKLYLDGHVDNDGSRTTAEFLIKEHESKVGLLTITVSHSATVYIDDVKAGEGTNIGPIQVNSGKHTISATDSISTVTNTVDVAEGERIDVALSLSIERKPDSTRESAHEETAQPASPPLPQQSLHPEPEPVVVVIETRDPLWLFGVGAGGIAVAAGVVAWIVAEDETASIESECSTGCTNMDIAEARSAAKTGDTIRNVALPAGLLVGVGSLACYLWATEIEHVTQASAWLTPDSAGVTVRGSL